MSSLIFVIKTFVLAVVVIFLLQLKLGPQTMEQRILDKVRNTYLHQEIEQTALSTAQLIQNWTIEAQNKLHEKYPQWLATEKSSR